MCAKHLSFDEIPLSQLNSSAYAVLSKHLDTLNTFRRDWRRIAREINLTLKEMSIVETCNEHMRKLIEIWNKYPPYPKLRDLIEILENLGCEDAIEELRECLEVSSHKGLNIQNQVPATFFFFQLISLRVIRTS